MEQPGFGCIGRFRRLVTDERYDAATPAADAEALRPAKRSASGTTLIAAERAGRRCFGLELDRHYCDLILRRWSALTGEDPVLAQSGLTFRDLS